jgi:nucleoid-associated protein YgaU
MKLMTALSKSRMIVPAMASVAAIGVALIFGIYQLRRDPPVDSKAATTAPANSTPASREAPPSALAALQAEASAVVAALGTSSPSPGSETGVPSFDIARIEPTGEAVIAGRAAPGATVELLRNGQPLDRAVADQAGQFAMIPPPLPSGKYDLTLRAKQPDGKQATSKQSVAVAIEPNAKEQPVVALMTPGKPAVVLSQPVAKNPAGTVVVEAVEIQPDGKFHVSGRARPGAAVRFYLNDSFVAPVTAGPDGRLTVTINEGVAPGGYRVRLDEVEAGSGTVRARAEVPFTVPAKVITGSAATPARAPKQPEIAAAAPPQVAAGGVSSPPSQRATAAATPPPSQPAAAAAPSPQLPAAGNAAPPAASSPSAVVVPKIATATVSPGDSLWRISELTYGAGMSYGVIYKANQEQIRNPHLIYPGQIFVLPTQ